MKTDEFLCQNISSENSEFILNELYSRYAYLVYGVCMKYLKNKEDAEDMTIQLFTELPLKISKNHPRIFKSWLYVLVKNECLMKLRKVRPFEQDINDEFMMELTPVDDESNDKILDYLLPEAIQSLKKEQKICIELFYLNALSYQAIAEQTGYPVNGVKSHIQNGKRNLKIILDKLNKNES